MEYSRSEVSNDIEKRILTGMIISTQFMRDIEQMISPKYFKIDYVKKISQWVIDYYKKYKAAPNQDFESIFYANTTKLKQAEVELMEIFLQSLSEQYVSEDKESFPFNKELLFDQTVSFCRDRRLEILSKTIEGHRLNNDFTKAEELIANYNKVAQNISQWVNPFDIDEIQKTFDEDEENRLLKLPGALGELIGYLHRGWLISLLGPTKKGKSFYEWEIGYHSLCKGLKVVIFSFEMDKTTYKKRIYKRMTAMAETGGEYRYPVFDCTFNQDGTCKKPQRKGTVKLLNSAAEIPEYSKDLEYKPCTVCRGTKEYSVSTWFKTQTQKKDLDTEQIAKKVRAFKKLYGDNLRIRAFPSFSAGFDETDIELDNLANQGFYPDVIIYDYFDIMSSEVMNELEDENRKWKRGKGIAGQRHALVVNCNQGNREAEEKKHLRQKHTGGNIKKLQHVDLEMALNQSEKEKSKGIMRIQTLIHRHDEGIEKGEVMVLQQLKLGQPMLDSEWAKKEKFIKGGEED